MQSEFSSEVLHVQTAGGSIAVRMFGCGEHPVLFIHGNSTDHTVFQRQVSAELLDGRRLFMLDLPGHGSSSDALDPHKTYTRPGLADAVTEVIKMLELDRPTLLGWSLGGHIAIEMLTHFPVLRGLAIIGAPPVANGAFQAGFRGSPAAGLASRPRLTPEEARTFADHILGPEIPLGILASIERCDIRFRERLFQGVREGLGVDQRVALEHLDVPIAIINGAEDPAVNLDYFDELACKRLFQGGPLRVPGAGHAPFWQQPERFNALLGAFLREV